MLAYPPLPEFPRVSLLIAMRNEANYIANCVQSALRQDYPAEYLEIFVLDGNSGDASWQIVEQLFQGRTNCFLLPNPGITQSAGWNLGIHLCNGDIIGIVSAHSELAPDYVSTAVETLRRTGADLIGGPARAHGESQTARAIAIATSTTFGVGGARFQRRLAGLAPGSGGDFRAPDGGDAAPRHRCAGCAGARAGSSSRRSSARPRRGRSGPARARRRCAHSRRGTCTPPRPEIGRAHV